MDSCLEEDKDSAEALPSNFTTILLYSLLWGLYERLEHYESENIAN